jgi:hypothetical protein
MVFASFSYTRIWIFSGLSGKTILSTIAFSDLLAVSLLYQTLKKESFE